MLLTSILCLLLSNSVTSRRDISIYFNRIASIILLYCIIQNFICLFLVNKNIGLFGGLINITSITQIFHIFILLISTLILQLTSFYGKKSGVFKNFFLKQYLPNNINYKIQKIINLTNIEHLKLTEYPLILLFVISGAIFLISSNDLISIFLSIEFQSYGLYILSTIYRNSELSTIGGLIYFLLGGLSSCFILLGISLLYTNSGTTNLEGIYTIINIDDVSSWYSSSYINFSLLILSIGFLFKISAAPFHIWSPDVYDAIPTIVTTFVAIVPKISIFILLLELSYYTQNSLYNNSWLLSLLMCSFFSLIIGTLVGLVQYRIKRLLAYSTISHIGFILLALSISSLESLQAFIFYLIQYSISNLNAFIILITIGFSLYYYVSENKDHTNLLDKNNSPIQLISQLKGYFYINPVLSLSLAITLFSFAGIPPLVGFFAKQMVLSAALDNGYVFMSLVAIITSVIGAVYYLNVVKEIFFHSPIYKINDSLKKYLLIFDNEKIKFSHKDIIISNPISITISIISIGILLFIFMNNELLSMSTILVQILFNN